MKITLEYDKQYRSILKDKFFALYLVSFYFCFTPVIVDTLFYVYLFILWCERWECAWQVR